MRALIITSTFPSRQRPSAGVFVRNQFQMLRKRAAPDDSVELFCVFTRKPNSKRSAFKVLIAVLRFIPYLFRRYDILHVHFVSPLLYAALLYKKLRPSARIVLTIHGSGLRRIELGAARHARRYARALKRVDHVIAAGPAIAPVVREVLDMEVHEILCAGVDELHFFREDNVVKEYDFAFVGAFEPCKGLDIMLDALDQLAQHEIKVCCIGSGSLEQRVRQVGQSVYVDILRDVPQRRLRRVFNQSRFLVFPSAGYGFGLVVSEAMYCGTPPIVFADAGAIGQVRHNENGLVYKPNTPDKLARVLADAHQIGDDTYDALATGAHNANREHSLETICRAHLGLYHRLAEGRPRARDTEVAAAGDARE